MPFSLKLLSDREKIVSKHLTPNHLKQLKSFSTSQWWGLVAAESLKQKRRLNVSIKPSIAGCCFGKCGVASILYIIVKNKGLKGKKYYLLEQKALGFSHTTVCSPEGEIIDVTWPQMLLLDKEKYYALKNAPAKRVSKDDFYYPLYFENFVKAVRDVLDEMNKKRAAI